MKKCQNPIHVFFLNILYLTPMLIGTIHVSLELGYIHSQNTKFILKIIAAPQ